MTRFNVGDPVLVAPDFSNDDFAPFAGVVVRIDTDAPDDPCPVYYVKDDEENVEPWLSGNLCNLP